MEEKSFASSRGTVYYWTAKNEAAARTVIFLPGLTADHRLFDRQTDVFSQKYTVVTWDAPAHGKSRPYSDFNYTNAADDLKGIMDAEGIKSAVFVGQSAGGFVSQSFIDKYPAMVEGLVTIGTSPFDPRYFSKSDFFWLRQIEWMAHMFSDKSLRKAMSKQCGFTEYGYDNMHKMLEQYGKDELCHLMYLGFAGFIPEVRDITIPCPVCLTVGEHDKTGKVMSYNKRWHEIEGYPLHIIKDAAHNANADNPEEVNRIVEEFIQGLPE